MNPTNLCTSARQGLVQGADFSVSRSSAAVRSRAAATAPMLALLMLAFLVLGCDNGAPTDTGAGGAGVTFDSSGGLDLAIADSESPAEDAAVAAEIAPTLDVGTAETAAKDVAVGPDLPPACSEGGCACAENSQCASGYCLDDAGSGVCAFSCTPACPSGSACKTLKAGNDDVQVCVPKFARLCDPCNQDSDCQGGSAGTTALCLDYADGKGNSPGKYCAGACDAASTCPVGYSCTQVKNATGALVSQCKRTDLVCPCSPRATKLGLGTTCSKNNANGTCAGKRFCDAKGLSPCGASEPGNEVCNGADDNCDGKTDEAACDDKNPCTADNCDPIKKACVNTTLTTSCDDGNTCTSKDTCKDGVCAGVGKNCDDSNPCTDDGCDAKGGCKYDNTTGPCVDDNPCVVGGQCKDGQCAGAKPKVCNDSNACTADNCLDGKCVFKQVSAPCDDGNACTTADVCDSGTCAGKAKVCLDNNACTEDSCDPAAAGGCKFGNAAAPCDDGNACTTKDFCVDGKCAGAANACNDSKSCTVDSCDPVKGCVNAAVAGSCDDNNPCTAPDACSNGACASGAAVKCDDANPCTTDSCDPGKGCVYATNSGGCDDKDACTVGDVCSQGKCVGGANQCGCQSDADCKTGSTNLCLGTPFCDKSAANFKCGVKANTAIACNTSADSDCKKTSCDAASGQCSAKAVNESGLCTDNNVCTTGDSCSLGTCKPTGNKDCEDNNACTQDGCTPAATGVGCSYTNVTTGCNDGDACTKSDVCSNGVCKGTGGAGCCISNGDCDDKNACTTDTCDSKTGGCTNAAVGNGGACNADSNGCTADTCQAGKCAAGVPVDCAASADSCNTATCNSTGATTYSCGKTAKTDGSPCDDGLFCTTSEACTAGKCGGGKQKDCSSSGCTTGVCDEATKACKGTTKPDGASCDADNSGCTKDDQCSKGACVAGVKVDCSNPFDVCNDIACNPTGAVTYQCKPTAKSKGAPCEDGKFCTDGDSCDGAGKCTAGGSKPCSEVTDSCNDATCDEPGAKCVAKPKADATPCNDGDTCTATDSCKGGLCQGQNNACGDFKISTFKTLGASAYRTPASVDMGGGRYRVAWATTDTAIAARSYRHDWSREFSEQTLGTVNAINGLQAVSTGANGANALGWSSYASTTGSCSAYYSSSCTTSNGCVAAAYADCGCCQTCTRYRYTYSAEHAWIPYDGVNVAGAKVTLATGSAGCTIGATAPTGVLQSATAGYVDGRRLVAYQQNNTVYRKILKADGGLVKDLGAEATAKFFDVAVHSDGTAIFVWDDNAEIWAQMYYSDGSTNGTKFQVNTKVTGAQTKPQVAFQPSGRYIVAWNTDQGGGDVQVQVFKPDAGSFLNAETTANTTVAGLQQDSRIAVYQDGSFGVVFEDGSGKDGGGYGILGQWYTSSGVKNGAERIVNATFGGDQRFPQATGLSSDAGVVAWMNLPDSHVYARKFDKNGNVLNGSKEFVVNATKAGEQSNPSVAAAGNGSFAVAWDSEGVDGDAAGIAVQRYAANGALIGGEVVVNTFKTGAQITPSIGMDTAGNFAVAWDSIGQDGDIDGIYAQRFKSDGSKAGAEVAISQTKANEQQKPVVAMLGDGSFAVAWESFGQSGGNKYDVILRCYDAAGAAVGNEQLVNTTVTDNQQAPHIVPFADGRYLVVWQSFAEDGAGWGVYGQLLYKDCKAIGNQFIVHTTKASDQTAPRAAADVNGAFVIVWSSLGQDGDNYGIYAQLFDKTGGKAGGEFKLNAVTAGEQSKPMVAFLPNGNFVATWQTVGEDEAGYSVKSVQFKGNAQQSLDWIVNTTFSADQSQPALVGRFDNSWVVAWRSLGQDGAKGAVIGRLFQ